MNYNVIDEAIKYIDYNDFFEICRKSVSIVDTFCRDRSTLNDETTYCSCRYGRCKWNF